MTTRNTGKTMTARMVRLLLLLLIPCPAFSAPAKGMVVAAHPLAAGAGAAMLNKGGNAFDAAAATALALGVIVYR